MSKELEVENTGLPDGWELFKFGDVCNFVRGPFGGSLKKSIFKESGFAVYEQKHAIYDRFDNVKYFVDEKKFNEMKRFELNSGDLIMSCSGTIGKIAIVPDNIQRGIINQALLILSPNQRVSNIFLKLWLQSENFQDSLKKYTKGAAIKNVASVKVLKNIEFPIPPLQQQKQIVAILDKAFAAIDKAKENAEQNLKNAKELFESYLQDVFENKGDDWEEKQIKDLTELVTKGSSPKWQGVNYVDEGGIFFLTSKNVGEGELLLNNKKYLEEKFNEIQKTSILKKGDVLTNIVGASIGRTAIFNLDEITNINQAVCLMRCNSEKVYNYYLMYLLNSPFFKNILHDNEVDNARANLSLTFFKNLAIPLPKLSEQKEIVKNIKSFSTETKKLEVIYTQKIADLEEMKKSLLQKAFNGELISKKNTKSAKNYQITT